MNASTKPTGINAPPLGGLDDDGDESGEGVAAPFAGLRRGPARNAPLASEAKDTLRRTAETSPLVTTRSHRPPPMPEPPPPLEKVVRDGYSIPRADHESLERLADIAMRGGHNIGKSGILRLGVRVLAGMSEEKLLTLAAELPPVPTAKRKR